MSLHDKIDQAAVRKFLNRVQKEALKEFGTDEEGKTPKLVIEGLDRTRCWPMHFQPVPYDHDHQSSIAELEEGQQLRMLNLAIAWGDFEAGQRSLDHVKRTRGEQEVSIWEAAALACQRHASSWAGPEGRSADPQQLVATACEKLAGMFRDPKQRVQFKRLAAEKK